MNKTNQKLGLVIGSLFLLTGCFENKRDTDQLCANNPGLQCQQLNMDDGQCRITRTDLIWHKLQVLKDPSDINKITEYQLTQKYQTCLEVAAQIQAIDQTDLKQRRFNALINAGKNLDRLSAELSEYHTPESLYFLWSQNNDLDARREFLQLEHSPGVQTARLQYALATFYIDRDSQKTIQLLHRALELSTDVKHLNLEIIKSLASVNQLLHQLQRSYIWAMVAKSFDIPVAGPKELHLLYSFDEEMYETLNEIADNISDAIEDGEYKASLIPDYIE